MGEEGNAKIKNIESEAEKGEIRSDGGNYGATGGSEDQGCADGEEVDDGAYGGEYDYVDEGEYEYNEDEG